MSVSLADLQVLTIAVKRSQAAGKPSMHVRTGTLMELGGECVSPADRARYANTPEAARDRLTSSVSVDAVSKLLKSAAATTD